MKETRELVLLSLLVALAVVLRGLGRIDSKSVALGANRPREYHDAVSYPLIWPESRYHVNDAAGLDRFSAVWHISLANFLDQLERRIMQHGGYGDDLSRVPEDL